MIAVIWEFFEYGMDLLMAMDLQHVETTGVSDTMTDLIVAFLGSIIFLIFNKSRGLNSK